MKMLLLSCVYALSFNCSEGYDGLSIPYPFHFSAIDMLSEEQVREGFDNGLDCAMLVLRDVSERIGMSKEEAVRAASCFGMGAMQGLSCGAVTAGLIAIGCKYGGDAEDFSERCILMAKREEFINGIRKEFKDLLCPQILGLDVRDPADMAKIVQQDLFRKVCPRICKEASELLHKIL